MSETETDDLPMPWDLLPSEEVCPACHLAYHRPLGACPSTDLHPKEPAR